MIQHEIPSTVAPLAAERYVRRAWPMLPSHVVHALFKKRDVKANGTRLSATDTVRGGDALTLYLPDEFLPAPAEIVFCDGHLLACVKPQGLPVDVDQDGIGADTLLTRLRAQYPAAQLCHRLDAATGGIVLAALDDETLAQALETFKLHALQKTYLALAKGDFARQSATLTAFLVKDARQSTVRVTAKPIAGSKPIETRCRVVRDYDGVAQVELEPVTGRTHQLRAHMAFEGHPLLGDDKYGDRERNKSTDGRLKLWCTSLEIAKNSPLIAYRGKKFTAAPPDWWETV